MKDEIWDAVIVGGGFAGLSAAIYLARALRRTLVIDAGNSIGLWEPNVQNYLGFPEDVSGEELLKRGREQAQRFGTEFTDDEVREIKRENGVFELTGSGASHRARRVLLATGLFHIPPEIPAVDECLGHSMFFCKDCDGYRVRGKNVAILGENNDAAEYALGMLLYSACVAVLTNGHPPAWDARHAEWLREYEIPVYEERIVEVQQEGGVVRGLCLEDRRQVEIDTLFTMRGDIFHTELAGSVGAQLDPAGQIVVNESFQTTVPGLYAAGCVTPSNCQMIIAAGNGAAAAQAINRDLLMESLRTHSLRGLRKEQLNTHRTVPRVNPVG